MVHLKKYLSAAVGAALFAFTAMMASADTATYDVGPGIVIAEVSPAEAARLESEFEAASAETGTQLDFVSFLADLNHESQKTELLYSAPTDGNAETSDLKIDVHNGCHQPNCMGRCPRCTFVKGSRVGHCKKEKKYFTCYR